MNIQEIRKKYPQYDDLSDEELAKGLHRKYYSDMPFEEFSGKIGLNAGVVKTGQALMDIPRQLGLTGRAVAGSKGLAGVADFFSTPVRAGMNALLPDDMQIPKIGDTIPDALNLPKPQNETERVVQDIGGAVAGAGLPIGMANMSKPITEMGKRITGLVSATPGLQATSAGAGAGAAGSVREAGGSELEQLGAGLAGAIGGPLAGAKATQAAKGVMSAIRPQDAEQLVIRINNILQPSGLTLADIPKAQRQAFIKDIQQATVDGGQLDDAALRRLVDYRLVGATPTRGSITLDPGIVTRQKNAAKMGANSTDPNGQRLANLENQNNLILQDQMDRLGAANAKDTYNTGGDLIDSISMMDKDQNARIGELYDTAKSMAGRNAELDSADFINRVTKELDYNLSTKFVPQEIKDILNQISGSKLPLTLDVAEQFKTVLAKAQRSATDGNVRYSLGIVRDALDGTGFRNGSELGEQALQAFNQARSTTRNYKKFLEDNPFIKKVINGSVTPDKAFEELVLRSPATTLENTVNILPEYQKQMLKDQVVKYIKLKGSNGVDDNTQRLTSSGVKSALNAIGTRKLEILFTPEEIKQLMAIRNVARFEQFQPVGSAVNNSNTASGIGGLVERAANSSILGKIPLGQVLAKDPLLNIVAGRQAGQAFDTNSVLRQMANDPRMMLSPTFPAGLLGND